MKIRLSVLAAASTFACPLVALAQSHDAALGQVVVTATRQPISADRALASVDVIEREQIERAGQSSLIDVLRTVPGLRVTSNGGPGSNASVFIRGAESRHTLLLIDGVRVGSASSGQATLEAIPLGVIERIEILRGPASALYGSDAIGGVIQVFTRKGAEGFRPELFVGYGSKDTHKASASFSGGVERLRYSLSLGEDRTRGFDARRGTTYDQDRDGFRNQYLNASVALGVREQDEIGLNLYHSDGRNWYDVNRSYDSYLDKRMDVLGVYYRSQLAQGWTSTLRAGRSQDRLDNKATAAAPSRFQTEETQFSWQNDVDLPLGVLLAAFDYAKTEVSGTTDYMKDERAVSAWMLGWTGSIDAHSLQANVRYDDNSQFGGETTGLLSYGYALNTQWSVHGSVATAFNAPTFNQLYWPDTGYGGGNPNLKPERALNREIGLRWAQGVHAADATYYDNKVRDLISGWPAINVNEARLKGVELAYRVALGNLSLQVGADWLDARDEATDKRLARRAGSAGFFSVDHRSGAWNYGLDVNAQSHRYENPSNTQRLAGFGLVDLFANYQLAPEWRLEMRANNILDKDYELARGYATEGDSYFIGVRYSPR